jgi:hypothetical protein
VITAVVIPVALDHSRQGQYLDLQYVALRDRSLFKRHTTSVQGR